MDIDAQDIQGRPWRRPDSPRIREFRLSVQSLLRGSDRDVVELANEVLEGVHGRRTRTWAIDVMEEIFDRCGLEFQRSMYDDLVTPSWEALPIPLEEEDEEQEGEKALESEQLDQMDQMGEEMKLPERLFHDNDLDSEAGYPAWETPPQTPRDSIDEICCIPCTTVNAKRNSRALPTPPDSPPNTSDAKESETESTPGRANSFIQNLRKRISRTSMKFRISIVRKINPISPFETSMPGPFKRPPPSSITKSSGEDIRTILHGPVLKINRLSDLSLPFTPEERREIARRRAHESKLTDDFDLVLRLGTIRTPRASLVITDMAPLPEMGETSTPIDQSSIPPVHMIEPDYFNASSSAPSSQSGDLMRSNSARLPQRHSSRIRNLHTVLSRHSEEEEGVEEVNEDEETEKEEKEEKQENSEKQEKQEKQEKEKKEETPARRESAVRNILSEENLRILTATMGILPPQITDAIPNLSDLQRSRSGSTIRQKVWVPTEDATSITSLQAPTPPISTGIRRRISQGRRYPSMDYFPIVQLTEVGLRGGRIGVVQMGSPYKANKILGDVVLLVPGKQRASYPPKRQDSQFRDNAKPTSPRGSVAKVEQLRGEKIPVESYRGSSERKRPFSDLGRRKSPGAVWII